MQKLKFIAALFPALFLIFVIFYFPLDFVQAATKKSSIYSTSSPSPTTTPSSQREANTSSSGNADTSGIILGLVGAIIGAIGAIAPDLCLMQVLLLNFCLIKISKIL